MRNVIPATLEGLRAKVKEEAKGIGTLPFAHNLVGLLLGRIAADFGQDEAYKAIIDFKLDEKGWATPGCAK